MGMGMGIEKAGGDPLATGIDDPLGQCRAVSSGSTLIRTMRPSLIARLRMAEGAVLPSK